MVKNLVFGELYGIAIENILKYVVQLGHAAWDVETFEKEYKKSEIENIFYYSDEEEAISDFDELQIVKN